MKDVLIKIEIINNEIVKKTNTKGIFDIKRNILTYSEEDGTKVKLDIKENKLERDNQDFLMFLPFSLLGTTKGTITFKENNQTIYLNLVTKLIDSTSCFYRVCYMIEEAEKIDYKIQIIK